MKKLLEDVYQKVNKSKYEVKSHVERLAEQYAEEFVSCVLGIDDEDGDGNKEAVKTQYIECFLEEIRKQI